MSYRYEGNGTFTDEKTEPKKQSASRSDDPWATPPKSQPKSQSKSRAKASDDKPSNSDMGSWIFIAFMFAVAWPIGLVMLISKLSESGGTAKKPTTSKSKSSSKVKKAAAGVTRSPKDTSGTARVLQIVGICLAAVGGLVALGLLTDLPYYLEYARWGEIFSDFSVAAAFLASGGGLMWGSWGMKRRMRRFAKYLAVAGTAQSVSITRLAAAAEVSQRRVERDLELMIEQGMWGKGAYVDLSLGKLYRSAAVAAEEQERRSAPVTPPQAEQGYAGMLRQIRIANDRIADQELSRKIERLEEIAGRIFRLIENDETKRAKASTFLSYYLPTTQKLLDSYAEFEEAGSAAATCPRPSARSSAPWTTSCWALSGSWTSCTAPMRWTSTAISGSWRPCCAGMRPVWRTISGCRPRAAMPKMISSPPMRAARKSALPPPR